MYFITNPEILKVVLILLSQLLHKHFGSVLHYFLVGHTSKAKSAR